jgi:hypothetical protein
VGKRVAHSARTGRVVQKEKLCGVRVVCRTLS